MGYGVTYLKRNFEELKAENLGDRVNKLNNDVFIVKTNFSNLKQNFRGNIKD